MAAVDGTVTGVFDISEESPKRTSAGASILHCKVAMTFAGTYASAGNAQTLLLADAVEAFLHDGRALTLIDASWLAFGNLNGSKIGAKTTAISTTTMTAELTQADASTEWADGAMSTTWVEPIVFSCTFSAA